MAAGIFQPFASAGRVVFRGGDLFFTSLRLALVTSAWLPDIDTETSWGEISSHEIPSGDGYTAGGKTLENVSMSDVEGGMKISSSQARWDATGAGIPAWRYMVLYIAGTVGGVANPLIGFALGDDTPADVPATLAGQSLFIPCPAGGWIELALLTAEDFATKAYADLQLVLAKAYSKDYTDTHSSKTGTMAHGATAEATSGQIVTRDAGGRARFSEPSAAGDVATKGWVEKSFPGFIFGLTLSNNVSDANNDIDVATGRAASDDADPLSLVLASAITKQLDATWVAGTSAGGLDTGTKAVSSTYHVFIISNGSSVDILFSLSATSPTMPSGYTLKRRIGSIMTDASGNIIAFHQNGDRFDLDTIVRVYNAGISTAVATVTAQAPTGIKTIARVALGGYASTSGGHYIQIYPKYQTPIAVGAAQVGSGASSGADNAGGYAEVETDTAAQFYAKRVLGSGTWTLVIVSLGWIDRRGQDG